MSVFQKGMADSEDPEMLSARREKLRVRARIEVRSKRKTRRYMIILMSCMMHITAHLSRYSLPARTDISRIPFPDL